MESGIIEESCLMDMRGMVWIAGSCIFSVRCTTKKFEFFFRFGVKYPRAKHLYLRILQLSDLATLIGYFI